MTFSPIVPPPPTQTQERAIYERRVYSDAIGRSVVSMTAVKRMSLAMFSTPSVSYQAMVPLPDGDNLPVTAPATCADIHDVYDWMDSAEFAAAAKAAFERKAKAMRKQSVREKLESSAGMSIPPGAAPRV